MRKKLALFTCFYLTVSANCATFPALSNDFGKGDVPGIIGRGITVGYDQKTQKSVVLAADKFSPAAGSCSFWIKPLDWTPADAPFCIFMTARGKDYRFMVFKQARGTLLVLVNFKGKTFKTTANISKWQKKQWHQITVIWSPGALHLYVDGNLNNSCDYPAIDSSFKVNQLTAGTLCWKAESGFSVIDEFKLFSAPLKDAEIQDSYQELASLTSASFDPFEVTVSPGKVKIDGAVSAGEYLSSFTGWYIPNGGFSDDAGSVHLASAKEKLFLALDYPRYAVPVLYTVKKDGRRVLQDSLSWQGKLPGTVETEIPFSDSDAGIFLQLAGKNGVEREIVPGDAGFLKINTVSKSMPFRIFKLGEINKGELNISFESSLKNTVAEISFADDRRCSFSEKMKFSDGKLNFKRRFAPDGRFCILLTGEGKTLFKAEIPAERSSRVTVTGFHTNIAKRTLELVFNKFRRNTAGCVMLTMKHLKSGKVYEKNIPVPGEKMKFSVSWPLVKMPDGDYVFKAQYVDETGKKGTPFERLYMVCASKAEWEDNRIGIYPGMVPSPWTPLKKLDNGLRMCMQEYRFGSGLFFDSIKSLGRELLAGPAVLRVNGKNVAAGEGTWLSFAPDTARFRQTGNAGDFDVSLDTCGEYDGLLKQTLRIKGNGTINSLQLEIPLKTKFCRQVYNNDRKGAVSGPGATGSIPASGWSRNLYDLPAVWVGNEQAGISWCAETLKNWSNRDRNKCIEIKPGKNSSRFILNLVDRPLKINGERIYEFYFQATPVRPGTGINPLKRINREILSVRGEKYFNYLRSGTEFFDEKKLVNNMALARARGVEKFLYYVNSAAIGTFTPEWAWWAEKWNARGTGRQVVEHNISDQEVRNRRIYSDCCLNSKSFSDFMIWQVSKIFTDSRFRTKNVYFDSAGPRLCRQKDHGCSWVDEDGKLHPTLVIDATRNFFKRIKHFAAEKAPQALFFHHASGMAGITACRSFADAFVGGENMYQGALVRKGSYIGVFDQDYFSTAFSGEKWGYPIYFIPQQLRAALMFRPQNAELWKKTPLAAPQRRSMRHIIGCFLVHGTSVWVRDQAVAEIQQPVHDLMLKTFGTLQGVQFVSQQSGNQPFKVKSDSRELRSGAYVKGNKCLVVLFNDTDRETGCSLLWNKEQKNLKVPPRDFVLEVFEIL